MTVDTTGLQALKALGGATPVKKPHEISGLALAFLGDCVWEILIRQHLLTKGEMKPDRLHKFSTRFVKAKAQSDVLHLLMEELTEEEMSIVKRGRNAKSGSSPKNADMIDYRHATGFESLLGYLHLQGSHERIAELAGKGILWLEQQTT